METGYELLIANALRLVGAAALGAIVGGLYRWSRDRGTRNPGFSQTLVLLAPLISMVTMAVGQNVAAAFTLVGTLAIVRFRTAIRDSRDMAFLIFAVAVGMAVGTFDLLVAIAGVMVIGAMIVVIRILERTLCRREAMAMVRLAISPARADDAVYAPVLGRYVTSWYVLRAAIDRETDVLDLRLGVSGLEPRRCPELLVELLGTQGVVRASFAQDGDA